MNSKLRLGNDPTQSWVASIIDWSVKNKLLVLFLSIILLIGGIYALKNIPLDAIPDVTDTQVIVLTDFPGQPPQVVEDLVTYPLSTAMLGLPNIKDVRADSMLGSSFIYVIFEDDVDLYWARSRVNEALTRVQGLLPDGAKIQMGPDATGLGWVYQYAVVDNSGTYDLSELRSLQDWTIKYELASVKGVAEVASVGGFVKEYQILIDPYQLNAYGILIPDLKAAIDEASIDVGGRVLELAETEWIIQSEGYVKSVADLEKVVVRTKSGTPLQLGDIARIIEGPALRRGITELNDAGEVVAGVVIARSGENALQVIDRVKARIDNIKSSLPEGVDIITVYDRAPLIQDGVNYLSRKLIEEGIVVLLVAIVFLLHLRSAFVAIISLPLGLLAAFVVMYYQGLTVNIMSLGGLAIAIGAMVDASIVMVENAHRKLSTLEQTANAHERRNALLLAMKEVGPGIFFSLLIITVSFLPVFALTGESFRLFSPLAFTKTYAMAFAALISITVVPILMLFFIRGRIRKEQENPINRLFIRMYTPLLATLLRHKGKTLLLAIIIAISTLYPLSRVGTEFMPPLYEEELLYMPTMLPGISTTEARQILQITNQLIGEIPEVDRVFGKAGRAETATDPAPLSMIETWIRLKPMKEWRRGLTPDALINELNQKVSIPGVINSWGYPIRIRMDMVSTGIKTPLGLKVTGDDLSIINEIMVQLEAIVSQVPGVRSAFADRILGAYYINISPDRDELARYGISLAGFQEIIDTVLGGQKITESIDGRARYDIMLRLDRPYRESINDISQLYIPGEMGQQIPLRQVASIELSNGPDDIKSENARLSGWIYIDIDGSDIGRIVDSANEMIQQNLSLPNGYTFSWSGQFEQLQEAKARLKVAIPLTVFIIFTLLMLHFNRLDRTLIVMLSLPFGLIGGVWALFFANYHFSVAVSVGFIALAGVAIETAVIMLIYLEQQLRQNPPQNSHELRQLVINGAALRVRPKLMTVATIIFGLLPIFITGGIGSDVMRRIALPMVGGMITTTVLTLLILPVIYFMYESYRLRR